MLSLVICIIVSLYRFHNTLVQIHGLNRDTMPYNWRTWNYWKIPVSQHVFFPPVLYFLWCLQRILILFPVAFQHWYLNLNTLLLKPEYFGGKGLSPRFVHAKNLKKKRLSIRFSCSYRVAAKFMLPIVSVNLGKHRHKKQKKLNFYVNRNIKFKIKRCTLWHCIFRDIH